MDKKKTGRLIKEARARKDYTQSELGDLLGVTNKAVSRWENGESFPDIGILECLSEILEVKIQDIVIGEVQPNDEKTITEIVRFAKIQHKAKTKKLFCYTIGIIAFLYSILIGYSGLINKNVLFGDASGMVYMISLAIMLIIFTYGSILQNENVIPRDKKISKWLCYISIFTFIWITSVTLITMIMVANGVIPFGMKLDSVGPFINNQLVAAFIINLLILASELYRTSNDSTNVHLGFVISIATLYLSALYGDMLHRLTTMEEVYQIFLLRTIVVIIEAIAAVFITVRVKRKGKRNNV